MIPNHIVDYYKNLTREGKDVNTLLKQLLVNIVSEKIKKDG